MWRNRINCIESIPNNAFRDKNIGGNTGAIVGSNVCVCRLKKTMASLKMKTRMWVNWGKAGLQRQRFSLRSGLHVWPCGGAKHREFRSSLGRCVMHAGANTNVRDAHHFHVSLGHVKKALMCRRSRIPPKSALSCPRGILYIPCCWCRPFCCASLKCPDIKHPNDSRKVGPSHWLVLSFLFLLFSPPLYLSQKRWN